MKAKDPEQRSFRACGRVDRDAMTGFLASGPPDFQRNAQIGLPTREIHAHFNSC
jgi:hypothetical protein